MTRHIDLQGIENFRDFGGYDTACGRGLKRGLLYRSANHAHATDADLDTMKAMGVSAIIDLRRPMERGREPSRRWAGFAGQVVENDHEGSYVDWAEALGAVDEIGAEWFRQDSLDFYAKAPFEVRHVDLFTRYFKALAETDGAIVVHCAAGKDRTGMICALTHHIAGVHEDDILHDYLLTNDETRTRKRMVTFGAFLKDLTGREAPEDALRTALCVEPDYLETAMNRMKAEHGTLDGYLANVLGVDGSLRDQIKAKILA